MRNNQEAERKEAPLRKLQLLREEEEQEEAILRREEEEFEKIER